MLSVNSVCPVCENRTYVSLYLIAFLFGLRGAVFAEIFSFPAGLSVSVLSVPQVKHAHTVDAHEQHCVRHQLRHTEGGFEYVW